MQTIKNLNRCYEMHLLSISGLVTSSAPGSGIDVVCVGDEKGMRLTADTPMRFRLTVHDSIIDFLALCKYVGTELPSIDRPVSYNLTLCSDVTTRQNHAAEH